MSQRPPLPSAATSEFLLPQPSARDVADLREAYRRRTGKEVSEDDARDVLSRIVRFMHLNLLVNAPCSDSDATPESPTTTAR